MRIKAQRGQKSLFRVLRHRAAIGRHQRLAIGCVYFRIVPASQFDHFGKGLGGVARIAGFHIGLAQIAPGLHILRILMHALDQIGDQAVDLMGLEALGFTHRQMRPAHQIIGAAAHREDE